MALFVSFLIIPLVYWTVLEANPSRGRLRTPKTQTHTPNMLKVHAKFGLHSFEAPNTVNLNPLNMSLAHHTSGRVARRSPSFKTSHASRVTPPQPPRVAPTPVENLDSIGTAALHLSSASQAAVAAQPPQRAVASSAWVDATWSRPQPRRAQPCEPSRSQLWPQISQESKLWRGNCAMGTALFYVMSQ